MRIYTEGLIEANGEISAYMGVQNTATANVGIKWSQNDGISPVKEITSDEKAIYPTIEGKGSITAKAWLYSMGSGAMQETPKTQAHRVRPIITINK